MTLITALKYKNKIQGEHTGYTGFAFGHMGISKSACSIFVPNFLCANILMPVALLPRPICATRQSQISIILYKCKFIDEQVYSRSKLRSVTHKCVTNVCYSYPPMGM